MSIEQLLADLTAGISALTVAINENTAAVKTLDAGRGEALEQLKAAGAGTAAPRKARAAKTEEPAAPTPEPAAAAAEPVTSSEPPAAAFKPDTSDDAIRALIMGWVKEEGASATDLAARADNLKATLAHFGSPAAVGPKSTLDADQRHQLVFFLSLFKAGLPVNFGADYDFASDPLTQVPVSEIASSDDDDDMIG